MATRDVVLTSPVASDGAEDHADWLELLALTAADQDSSYQDLVAELRRAGTLDALTDRDAEDSGSELSQQLADDAFAQLDIRAKSCGTGYPFEIDAQVVRTRVPNPAESPYVFMLLLKSFGVGKHPRGVSSATVFEELATAASDRYLGGPESGSKSYHFGFPRRTTPAGFRDALDELCKELNEGGGAKSRPSRRNQKDAKLDLVAWKPFLDRRNGKIIVFGQCAAGDNWDTKASELSPMQFTGMWMNASRLAFTPIVFFFLPRCIDDEEFDSISMIGNTVPFDRCRIASMLSDATITHDVVTRMAKCSKYVLERVQR